MTVEPGRLLAGRYRVEDLLTDRAGARSWRAVDEVLRRSVAVDVLPADAPRADALLNAARTSASVTDSRFLRVLDASHENSDVYVVREWARGEPLDRVLGDGPLPHRRAAWVVREVAEALAIAHRAGIYHWRLVPGNVVITDTGAVRVVGLATEAALAGIRYPQAEAELEDVRGLGRLLYCTLVNRWPGGPDCDMRRAPHEHGRLMRPRQVRAGVPRSLDEICDRMLGDPPQHHATPLRGADEVAAALSDAAGLSNDSALPDPDATAVGALGVHDLDEPSSNHGSPVGAGVPAGPPPAVLPTTVSVGPKPAPARRTGGTRVAQAGNGGGGTTVAPVAQPGVRRNRRDPGRWKWSWLLVFLVVLVCAVAAFLIGFTFTDNGSEEPSSGPTGQPTATTKPVQIAQVSAWDPMGEGGENDDDAGLAADGDPSTTWQTMEYYGRPDFGGLKPGLGLVLDLGERQDVSRVTVNVGGDGTDFEIRVAPGANEQPPSDLDDYQVQGKAQGATGTTAVDLNRSVTTRYVLVWLTKLPPEDGDFRGRVHEVSVAG